MTDSTAYIFAAPKTDLTADTAREHYRHTLLVASYHGIEAADLAKRAKFVLHKLDKQATPINWVLAAQQVSCRCDKCSGSGIYGWGAVTNGKPAHSGKCFSCGGTGSLDHTNRKRNVDYWHFGARY